jgi:hypothetical protein
MSRRVQLVLHQGSYALIPLHVQLVIASYLGPAPNVTLSETCSFGSIALLDWMWEASCTRASERTLRWSLTNFLRSELHYYRYQFAESMKVAAKRGDVAVVAWLLGHFRDCVVPAEAVGKAADNGHLDILKLLWGHDSGRHDRERQEVSMKRKVVINSGETGSAGNNMVCWGDSPVFGVRHPDVARWLHEHSLPKRDDELEEAIRAAVNIDDWELAKFFLPPGRCLLDYGAYCRKPKMIEWMLDCGYLQRDNNVAVCAIRDLVFRSENLPLMQRIAEQHKPPYNQNWNEVWSQAMACVCQCGQLKTLQWLAEHPTGVRICGEIRRHEPAADVTAMALDRMPADVDMLQYLYDQDLFVENAPMTVLLVAVHDGQPLEVLKWLLDHQPDSQQLPGYCVMDDTGAWGHLDVLQYFHSLQLSSFTTRTFSRGDEENADAPSWCTDDAMNEAAANGHLDVVKWLHANRPEGCSTLAMDGAASNGNLEVVKWLHEHRTEGCTTDAMDDAAGGGHLDVVQWLHSNREEGCTSFAMDSAARSGHLDVVKWLHRHRSEGATKDALDGAADNGHLNVVQWLHEHRSEGCTTDAVHFAAVHGHFEVLLFLHSQRTEGCSRNTLVDAALGNSNIVEWLHQDYPDA